MNLDFYKQKGFWLTFLTSILIISVALVTDLKMDLFVPMTGKFRLFGGVGAIISITLLFKWKYSRHVLGIITVIYLIGTISFAFHDANRLISFSILSIVLISILILLSSIPVNDYMKNWLFKMEGNYKSKKPRYPEFVTPDTKNPVSNS